MMCCQSWVARVDTGGEQGFVFQVAGNGCLVVGLLRLCCSPLYTAHPL